MIIIDPMHTRRLSILGVGLLGGSLALAVRRVASGCQIVGYGHRKETLDTALAKGVIDEAFTDPAVAVKGADLVVLATPVGTFGELIRAIGPALDKDAVVTDVGSTKRSIVTAAAGLPWPARFVGSHPMAGSEKRGVDFADANLYQKALCIVTPTPETDRTAVARVETMWRSVGMRIMHMTPTEHDARVSLASHLPHALAAALMLVQDDASLGVAGKGLADTTRIAAGDAGLWRDIFVDNRDNLRHGIATLQRQLEQLTLLLEKKDADAIQHWLNDATARRAAFASSK